MSSSTDLTLSILLVDDDLFKTEKVTSLINSCSQSRIVIADNQIQAQQFLLQEKFDLLILDILLPLRHGEGEAEENGGQKILQELEIDESYFQPDCIIALTEYDNLQLNLQESFADIAAIKFDATSTGWEINIKRVIARLLKAKSSKKKIIYCEGRNAYYYNLIGLHNIEFRGLSDSRAVYLSAKNEPDNFALRDKDFLTKKEIKSLQSKFNNYLILQYYCFENYLYHPNNIDEVVAHFDKTAYIEEITNQKKAKLMTIVQDYKLSRNAYSDLNDDGKALIDIRPESEIIVALESDDFEIYYPYFDMAGKKDTDNKKSFDKNYLAKLNLDAKILAQTTWFKQKIGDVINPILDNQV